MTLTTAQKQIALRALKVAIESRETDRRSFMVRARCPEKGRLICGNDDITDEVKRDLDEFRELQRRMR